MANANKTKTKAGVAPGAQAPGTQVTTSPAKLAKGELAVIQSDTMPDYLQNMEGARGNENVATDDLVIPRLEIIQAISPEVMQGQPEYIPAAKPGMLMNSVTKQLYGAEVIVVPVHYVKQWLVWRDRKQGGGFYGAFPDSEAANTRLQEAVKEAGGGTNHGIAVIDTPTHLCLLVNMSAGTVEEIMIPMPRTKAKRSREWNSMIKLAGGDRFARVYRISTVPEQNAKGNFYNYAITQFGFPAKPIYQQAEKLHATVGTKSRVMDTKGFGVEADDDNKDM